MDEPGNFGEVCGAKNVEFGLLGNLFGNLLGNRCQHPSMLPEATENSRHRGKSRRASF